MKPNEYYIIPINRTFVATEGRTNLQTYDTSIVTKKQIDGLVVLSKGACMGSCSHGSGPHWHSVYN